MWEASPIRYTEDKPHTEGIIDTLFPYDPLLCVGRSNYKFDTRSREEWRGQLSAMQFIVPNPMSARTGKTQDGKDSVHCLNNTGSRRFLLVEQDIGSADDQAAVLLYLKDIGAPLVMAVHSGGKSIHGWFFVAGMPEDELRKFMCHAVSLGADRALWTRSQFSRMPDGLRDNGKRQSVMYMDPAVVWGREVT